jgi:transcriptional regulator with GAF, ATPase, and Fis domain
MPEMCRTHGRGQIRRAGTTTQVDGDNLGCHYGRVVKHIESAAHAELFEELKQVREAAIEHYVAAQRLNRQRRQLIDALLAEGFSQADVARELGVTRQAIQKMMALGQGGPRR